MKRPRDRRRSRVAWYLASLIERFEPDGCDMTDPKRRCLAWENWVLIRADDPDEAYEKAMQHGRDGDGNSISPPEGPRGTWRFEGLASLMPIYEYRCRDCGARSSVFFRSISVAENATPACEGCSSAALDRLISRTVVKKGVAGRIDEFNVGGALNDLDRSGMMDSGSFARWARKMSDEMGDEMGAKFRDLAEKAEAGADPGMAAE